MTCTLLVKVILGTIVFAGDCALYPLKQHLASGSTPHPLRMHHNFTLVIFICFRTCSWNEENYTMTKEEKNYIMMYLNHVNSSRLIMYIPVGVTLPGVDKRN